MEQFVDDEDEEPTTIKLSDEVDEIREVTEEFVEDSPTAPVEHVARFVTDDLLLSNGDTTPDDEQFEEFIDGDGCSREKNSPPQPIFFKLLSTLLTPILFFTIPLNFFIQFTQLPLHGHFGCGDIFS